MKKGIIFLVFALMMCLFENLKAQAYAGVINNQDGSVFCTYHTIDNSIYSEKDLSIFVVKYIEDIERKMVIERKFEFKKPLKKYTYPDSSGYWQGAKFYRIIPVSTDSIVLDSIVIPPYKPESTIEFEKPTVSFAEGHLPDTTITGEIRITKHKKGEKEIYIDLNYEGIRYGVQIFITLKNSELRTLDIVEYDDGNNHVVPEIFEYNSKNKKIQKIFAN